ncbi:MAG: metal-dependent hydrolase [Dehalococcoidia bacterium]
MLLLAHVGYTVGGGWLAQRLRFKEAVDFRLLVFMAILPDIIDRALWVLVIPDAQSGRLVAHTLIFQLVLFAVLVAIRRGFWIYGLASLMHLALDAQGLSPEQAFWPFTGADLENLRIVSGSAPSEPFWERALDRVRQNTNAYTEAGALAILLDMGGLVVLAAFAVSARLYERGRFFLMVWRGSAFRRR